jgi:ubiquinone/menaquinone biosynthesis C-methylase UbiE
MDKNKIIRLYSEFSSQFDKKIGSLKSYDESYTHFVVNAERKKHLLDLACGPGNVSSFIKTLEPNIEITCVDLSNEMLKIARDKIGEGDFYTSDILNIDIPYKKYDLITCAFGIPYIKSSEVEKFANEVNRFSQKGTAVYISCMSGDTIEKEPMSFAENQTLPVQRHQNTDIITIFEIFDFEMTDFRTQDYKEPDGSFTTDMIFNFRKR